MAIVTKGKGGKRQILLVIVLVIMAVIVGVYLYSNQRAAPAPTAQEAIPPRAAAPEAMAPEVAVPGMAVPEAGEVKPKEAVRPEAMSSERITKILKKLEELDLVLYGKLPIEVDPKEIGRANPFIAPPK